MRYFLSEHPDAMQKCISVEDCYGHTPLKRAVAFGYDNIAKLLRRQARRRRGTIFPYHNTFATDVVKNIKNKILLIGKQKKI